MSPGAAGTQNGRMARPSTDLVLQSALRAIDYVRTRPRRPALGSRRPRPQTPLGLTSGPS